MSPPRIAIVGGGPSGLVLLNILARHNISATLYERDEQFSTRSHLGGMLDLHVETGQAAIRAAGLWEPFAKHSRPEGQEMAVTDCTGVPVFHYVPTPEEELKNARPEIDRTDLRKILVDGAAPNVIKWGHAFVSATPVPGTAQWEVSFENGFKTVVDLLIGADGASSRVRPLVSDAKVTFSGITGVEVSWREEDHPDLAARIGKGSLYAFDEYKNIIGQRNGDGRIRVYAFFRSETKYVPPQPSDPASTVADILTRFGDNWAPWLRAMVQSADLEAVYPRSLSVLPVGHTWPHRAGVTLIGDAMTLMTPYAGKGANTAMQSAMKLALALDSVRGRPMAEIDTKIAEFEKEMCAIGAKDAAETDRNMKWLLFSEHGAQNWPKIAAEMFPQIKA